MNARAVTCSGMLLLSFCFGGPAIGNVLAESRNPQEGGVLIAGAPVERELAGDETHTYLVALLAGQYLRVVVAQRSIDVVVNLFSPEGRKLDEVNNPNEMREPERVWLVSESSGNYRLEIRAAKKEAARGSYEVKIEDLRTATPQDESRVVAERAFAEGERLRRQEVAQARRTAIEKFEEAATHFRLSGDRAREGSALNNIGYVYGLLSEYQKAIDHYTQSLRLSRETGDRRLEATTLLNLGLICRTSGENHQALDYYRQALAISKAASEREREAAALNGIGAVYIRVGEPHLALEHFIQALSVFRSMGLRRSEATLINNIGFIYSSLGENHRALEYYTQAGKLSQIMGDQRGEADTNINLGSVYQRMGESQKSLEHHTRALSLFQAAGNRQREAIVLNNLGFFYDSLGEPQKSLEYYRRALEISRSINDRSESSNTLNNLGLAHLSAGEYQQAEDCLGQALELKRAIKDRRGEARTLINFGTVYEKSGAYQKALEHHTQALTISRSLNDRNGEAYALHNSAAVYERLGKPEQALDFYHQALKIRRAAGERPNEAETLFRIARIEHERGNLHIARAQIEQALEITESVRVRVAGPELRSSYFASRRDYYDLYIDLLMNQHKLEPSARHDLQALEVNERALARSLLETLAEARVDIRQGVDAALLERERKLQQRINSKERVRQQQLSSADRKQIEAIEKEVEMLLTEYQQVRAQIRATSPHYAGITQALPLSLKEIQRQVLDDDTLLLEYALGEKRSYLWAVTRNEIESFELPKRDEIEAASRRVYDLLTARNQRVKGETAPRRRSRITKADAGYAQSAGALSRMLLGPAATLLAKSGKKRLLIVSSGALQYIPFGALPQVQSPTQRSFRPLVVDYEIVRLPSASTLAMLRQDARSRPSPEKLLATFADPVFEADDPRIGVQIARQSLRQPTPSQSTESLTAEIERSARESGVDRFLRLRFTRAEAEAIASLAPEDKRFTALDFAASRSTLAQTDLSKFRFIHFATHGLLNSQHPELSGIVLSLIDEQGQPQDGFLRFHEIYNLKVNADLVVLSGCRTALGKQVRGEGLIGLTRGFMYAGAKSVMASLWGVEDKATAELMRRFYAGLFGQNQSATAALRLAQLKMLKNKQWAAPYFWAAFTMQGEWKQ